MVEKSSGIEFDAASFDWDLPEIEWPDMADLDFDWADMEWPEFITGTPAQKQRFELLRLARDRAGAAKYGPLDPATDRRNLIGEAVEEIADAANYLTYALWQMHFSGSDPARKARLIGKVRELARQLAMIGENFLALVAEHEGSGGDGE